MRAQERAGLGARSQMTLATSFLPSFMVVAPTWAREGY